MPDLSAEHDALRQKLTSDRNRFFKRAWKDSLSPLLSALNINAGPNVVLVGERSYRGCIDKWLKASGAEPEFIEHSIWNADDALVWAVPPADTVFLFETLSLVHCSAICLRKLSRSIRKGGFVIAVSSVSSDSAGTQDSAGYRKKIAGNFEDAGFEIIKNCIFFNRFFGRAEGFQKDGPKVFSVLEDGRVVLESPDCIPAGNVLESVAFNLVIARRSGADANVTGVSLKSLTKHKVKTVKSDRLAEYFVEPNLLDRLGKDIVERVKKCISTSFRNLEEGRDYDVKNGRSLYIKLPESLAIGRNVIKAIKIKGATFNSDEPFAAFDAVPDSMLAFDRRGIFFRPNFDDKPMGSMTFSQSCNEFDIMTLALRRKINTDYPCGLVRYPDVFFQNRITGSVIIGVEDIGGENLFFDSFSRIFGEVSESEKGDVRISVDKKAVMKAAAMLVKYGRALRHMHQSGIIHVLGHNRQLSLIDERFVFHDFEYSLSQSGMTRLQKAAYRLQDIRRCLFGLKIFRSRERLGLEFAHCFGQGYFGANSKFARSVDDKVIEDKLFKFYDSAAAEKDALISWMLDDI